MGCGSTKVEEDEGNKCSNSVYARTSSRLLRERLININPIKTLRIRMRTLIHFEKPLNLFVIEDGIQTRIYDYESFKCIFEIRHKVDGIAQWDEKSLLLLSCENTGKELTGSEVLIKICEISREPPFWNLQSKTLSLLRLQSIHKDILKLSDDIFGVFTENRILFYSFKLKGVAKTMNNYVNKEREEKHSVTKPIHSKKNRSHLFIHNGENESVRSIDCSELPEKTPKTINLFTSHCEEETTTITSLSTYVNLKDEEILICGGPLKSKERGGSIYFFNTSKLDHAHVRKIEVRETFNSTLLHELNLKDFPKYIFVGDFRGKLHCYELNKDFDDDDDEVVYPEKTVRVQTAEIYGLLNLEITSVKKKDRLSTVRFMSYCKDFQVINFFDLTNIKISQ